MLENLFRPLYRTTARAFRRARALTSRKVELIDLDAWNNATANYRFVQRLTTEENRRLRLISSDFLARKVIMGAAGFEITELMRLQIAAQACILILELDVDFYDGWREIIVYPGQFAKTHDVIDEFGVVHTTRDPLAGEAWLDGPVVLSHADLAQTADAVDRGDGYNVVIHEFAHKLDMLNGEANGYPPLHRGMSKETWKRTFLAAYLAFCKQVDEADALARRDGGKALDAILIDPYAAQSPAEFFAVISEVFFEMPEDVHETFPAVYQQLKAFYKQDPLARQ
ncbi:MAG: zinc-dependent peptidase [Burkholderiales bacterium]|nr:zinc-dependent peptidase [Burkholderiales bacterium]